MKLFGFEFGPVDRPSEESLKSAVAASDARLNQESTFTYSPDDFGEVDMADLRKGTQLDSEQAPDDGFEPRPVLGGTKTPW